ncbi:hypothetical protein CEUSTIGMA_g7235.t1 [Chlamydomonas eustigma]|uniref:Uncharacterized protein n=1 Tax=Chlamydomonas eustigma TaxID=1157962 RepID=A0A250X9L2_9CHLO|nr:hypothetical protein CEUSTIGMA_g7235.t1 [Chlamydomonas eustigma]|eukprot:GAX79795.1 hypothetical protein CEUSTIGMA_g7235.t1 [Chlamydomonas eustigma]
MGSRGMKCNSYIPRGVPFDVGLAKVRRTGGGVSKLVGWSVQFVHQKKSESLGSIIEVIFPSRRQKKGTAIQDINATSMHDVLIKSQLPSVLQPQGYQGVEEHIIPLNEHFVQSVDLQREVIEVQLPRGFLSLGRRSLYLGYLAQQLPQFARKQEQQQPGLARAGCIEMLCMPTRKALQEAGRKDLVDLVLKCGGFSEVAVELGMRSKRRPAGYWDNPEHLDAELRAFIASQWLQLERPSESDQPGKPYFYNQVSGRIVSRLPGGLSLQDVRGLAERENAHERVMPSSNMLMEVGRYDLHHAIVSQGGYLSVGHLLERRPPREGREPIIHSKQELIEEISWFIQQQQQQQKKEREQQSDEAEYLEASPCQARADETLEEDKAEPNVMTAKSAFMPTEREFLDTDRADIISAIRRYGGYKVVSELMGLQIHRRPRAFWKDINNVVEEVKSFVSSLKASSEEDEEGLQDSGKSVEAGGHLVVGIDFKEYRLPTQKMLIEAGRQDLLYAIQLHGHETVARRCGMKVERRGLQKGRLTNRIIVKALSNGCSSVEDVIAWLRSEKGIEVNAMILEKFLDSGAKKVGRAWIKNGNGIYVLPGPF